MPVGSYEIRMTMGGRPSHLAKRDCRCSVPQKRWRAEGFQQFKSLIERRLNSQNRWTGLRELTPVLSEN